MPSRTYTSLSQEASNLYNLEPRQHNAANGGGEPPSSGSASAGGSAMFQSWIAERRDANLTMTELLYVRSTVEEGMKDDAARL